MDPQTPVEVVTQPEATLFTSKKKFFSYFLLILLSLGGMAFAFLPIYHLFFGGGGDPGLAGLMYIYLNAILVPIAWVLVYWTYRLIQYKFKLYRPKEIFIILISASIVVIAFPAIWMNAYYSVLHWQNSSAVSKLESLRITTDKDEIKDDQYIFSINILNQGKTTFSQMPIQVGVLFRKKDGSFQDHIWFSGGYTTTLDIPPGSTKVSGSFQPNIIQDSTLTDAYLEGLISYVYVTFNKSPYNVYPYYKAVGMLPGSDYQFVANSTFNWADYLKKSFYIYRNKNQVISNEVGNDFLALRGLAKTQLVIHPTNAILLETPIDDFFFATNSSLILRQTAGQKSYLLIIPYGAMYHGTGTSDPNYSVSSFRLMGADGWETNSLIMTDKDFVTYNSTAGNLEFIIPSTQVKQSGSSPFTINIIKDNQIVGSQKITLESL